MCFERVGQSCTPFCEAVATIRCILVWDRGYGGWAMMPRLCETVSWARPVVVTHCNRAQEVICKRWVTSFHPEICHRHRHNVESTLRRFRVSYSIILVYAHRNASCFNTTHQINSSNPDTLVHSHNFQLRCLQLCNAG